MPEIIKKHITTGVTWIEIKKADLYLCCGCPADTVKHLKNAGVIHSLASDNWTYENGPNAILLSDTLIQNGKLANLSEFVILQMLYLQGVIIPGHPNYFRFKPLLIGYQEQISKQLEYVNVGNHGLDTIEEIIEAGQSKDRAEKIFATKLHYAGGEMKKMNEMADSCVLNEDIVEIKNKVFIQRIGVNNFKIFYQDEVETIDIGLQVQEQYLPPYELPFRNITVSRFSVSHTGEGNGWDVNRPCMASIIHHKGKVYLIDAGPNILNNLTRLGIGLSEIDGIFLSHIHDDHFAGITELLNVERRLNLYTTKLIRKTAEKKLFALFNSDVDLLHIAFNCIDLEFEEWNNIQGLEVQPTYSPHTVETTIFNFRVKDGAGYKTYLHLADTINFTEFDKIIKSAPHIFNSEDRDYVIDSYLAKVNLKKLDVGGGLIHGHLADYTNDLSDKLVMAHTTDTISAPDHRFVNAEFGDTDHLIEDSSFDLIKVRSQHYLKQYFPSMVEEGIHLLSKGVVVNFKPGEEINKGEKDNFIYLIISGLVGFKNHLGTEQILDAGNFIGHSNKYFTRRPNHQYYAKSYVCVLQYLVPDIDQIFSKYNLTADVQQNLELVNLLRDSYLIQYSLSNASFYELAQSAKIVNIPDSEFTDQSISEYLYILIEGKMSVVFEGKYEVIIKENQHFGGLDLLKKYRKKQKFSFSNKIQAISLPVKTIQQVPAILWKLIELEEKRYQLSIFENK